MPRDASELAERVRRAIARAELRTGDRLGSERALAEQFGVPRSALREALEELESEGRIRRTMGRTGGVFVSDGKIERQLNTIQGVPDMLRQQGFSSSTTVLEKGIGLASPAEARNLALAEGDNVYRMRRLRIADGVPLSIDTMALPMRLLPGFQDQDHSGSVYRLLSTEYRIEMHQADETIDVAAATAQQASLLKVEVGAPLFEIWRVTLDASETPVEYSHDFFRADRTRISLRRYGSRWKRAVAPAR
ncbi:GntR family transcriptional regulator [Frondihabitans australicus]|uniref:GntR family transcriptional regulator n=1 Tax=Frondihabitans australicus TaxID=386892 RepID=A0A495IN61_9MICO|nr:GntR family transcriptional regulator [Frondihabitans australicus]RKR76621.1 GntR family transcriptional regulator [Frondihabitans australicus]